MRDGCPVRPTASSPKRVDSLQRSQDIATGDAQEPWGTPDPPTKTNILGHPHTPHGSVPSLPTHPDRDVEASQEVIRVVLGGSCCPICTG